MDEDTVISIIFNRKEEFQDKLLKIRNYKKKLDIVNNRLGKKTHEIKYSLEVIVNVENGEDIYRIEGTEDIIREHLSCIVDNEKKRQINKNKYNRTFVSEHRKFINKSIQDIVDSI